MTNAVSTTANAIMSTLSPTTVISTLDIFTSSSITADSIATTLPPISPSAIVSDTISIGSSTDVISSPVVTSTLISSTPSPIVSPATLTQDFFSSPVVSTLTTEPSSTVDATNPGIDSITSLPTTTITPIITSSATGSTTSHIVSLTTGAVVATAGAAAITTTTAGTNSMTIIATITLPITPSTSATAATTTSATAATTTAATATTNTAGGTSSMTITATTTIAANTTITSTITTAAVTAFTNTVMSSSSTTAPSSAMNNASGVVAVFAIIIVAVLLVAVIVTILVILFFWRKNKKNNKLVKKPPLFVSGFSISEDDHAKASDNNNDQGLSKNNLELKNRSPDCQAKYTAEMLTQSQEQTLSLINSDFEKTKETDCFSITESTIAIPRLNFENSTFTEFIDPATFMSDEVCDSTDNDGLAPCTSIYADPIPLVKSKGPPVVTVDNIKHVCELGTGLFGQVILANTVGLSYLYLGIGSSNDTSITMKVAVKILKTPATAEIKKAFDKEIRFMSRLKDDNVIRLLGICTTGTPFIMMEYMENGDLNGYLQQMNFTTDTTKIPVANEITLNGLVYISYQIASGMKYLSSCKYVHRDLAARNVLVGINHTVKIADFGMSQNLYSAYYCIVGGRSVLPIRWMANECFFGKFSVKTDVWAFGITLWEIFTLCRFLPYNDLTNQQMVEDVTKGANRMIPSQPENCPDDIYCIMKSCLHHDPSQRAEFTILCDQLNNYYINIL